MLFYMDEMIALRNKSGSALKKTESFNYEE